MSDQAFVELNKKYVSKCEELDVLKKRLQQVIKSNNESVETLMALLKSYEKKFKKCSCKDEEKK